MTRAGGRYLAVDLGQSRIGLAVCDALGLTTTPLPALDSRGAKHDLERLARIVDEQRAVRVVVGLPLLLSGAEGDAAAAARRFARRLAGRLRGITVELWDERLTTVEAERMLVASNVGRHKRRHVLDGVAAELILRDYLDAHDAHDERDGG